MHRPNSTRGSKHKPSKGQNMFKAQTRKAEARRKAQKAARQNLQARKSIPEQMKAKWRQLQRWFGLSQHLKGKYTPHQGEQEKARRRRQMATCKCIDIGSWYTHEQYENWKANGCQ